MGDGKDTSFWEDVWVGETPLKLLFPKLYEYCSKKKCTVQDFWREGEWVINFRRTLSVVEATQWDDLLNTIKETELTGETDSVKWALEKSGQYTTRSMYRMLAHRGVVNQRMRSIWGCRMPLKLKIFLWLTMQNRLQT